MCQTSKGHVIYATPIADSVRTARMKLCTKVCSFIVFADMFEGMHTF